jgi:isopentenyl-diphosphate delta-isomerase type 1
MNTIEKIILVDQNDQFVGIEEKIKAHEQALCHRAFSVFVFRKIPGQVELLIHRREKNKYHCGGLWTNTTCGHPRPDEETQKAALRRLKEEMGFGVDLKEAGKFHYRATFDNGLTENEIDHVFVGFYHDEKITPDPAEIDDYRWISLTDLKKDLLKQPNQYTPWFERAFEIAQLMIQSL